MPSNMPRLIKIHTIRYSLVNPDRKGNEPQFLYDEVLPVFYAPGVDEHERVWIRSPEYLTNKLSRGKWNDGYDYFRGSTLGNAEEKMKDANEEVRELLLPKVKKKIILFTINAEKLSIDYEILYLVTHGERKFYTLETPDGNVRHVMRNMWTEGDIPTHINWTPEAEEWFKNAKDTMRKIEHQIHTMLMKPHYDDDGKLTGYGHIAPEDINVMVNNKTFPFLPSLKLLEAGE